MRDLAIVRKAPRRRTFSEWMAQIDAMLFRRFGLTSSDLSDVCYHDWYSDGMSCSTAARMALANDGYID